MRAMKFPRSQQQPRAAMMSQTWFATFCSLMMAALLLHPSHRAHAFIPGPTSPRYHCQHATSIDSEARPRFRNRAAQNKYEDVQQRKEELTQDEERPRDVQFIQPLLQYGFPQAVEEYENRTLSSKPILLYVPGFDGTFLSPFLQYPELGQDFDVRCMTVGMQDRSTFGELKAAVISYLEDQLEDTSGGERISPEEQFLKEKASGKGGLFGGIFSFGGGSNARNGAGDGADDSGDDSNGSDDRKQRNRNGRSVKGKQSQQQARKQKQQRKRKSKLTKRPVYLAGESFGGVLVTDIALTMLQDPSLKNNLQGITLINPATCYERSQLALRGPAVANLPKALYTFGILWTALTLFTDDYSVRQLLLIFRAKALPSVIDDAQREAYMGRVAFSLPRQLQYMEQGTFRWRLEQWLSKGCTIVNEDRLNDFAKLHPNFRCLIVAGENDKTLPSIAEAERLANILPQAKVHVVDGAGHASTCGSRIDLTAIMRARFQELARGRRQPKRTSMKEVARLNEGVMFGMEPRYDGASFGLSTLDYWSKRYYKKVSSKDYVN